MNIKSLKKTLSIITLLLIILFSAFYIFSKSRSFSKKQQVQIGHPALNFEILLNENVKDLLFIESLAANLNSHEFTLSHFMKNREVYSQIRLLDDVGQEVFRMNYLDKNRFPEKVDNKFLQNKGDRYYFKALKKVAPDQIYLSKLDINVEKGYGRVWRHETYRLGKRLILKNKNYFLLFNISPYSIKKVLNTVNKNTEQSIGEDTQNNCSLFNLLSTHLCSIAKKINLPRNINNPDHSWFLRRTVKISIWKEFILMPLVFAFWICSGAFILYGHLVHKYASKELHDYKKTLDETAIFSMTDINGKIEHVNKKFIEISGYDESELLGKDHRIVNSGHHPKHFFQEMWETIKNNQIWRGIVRNQKKDGSFYWVDTTIVPILNRRNEIIKFGAIRFDITKEKELMEKVNNQELLYRTSTLASMGKMSASIAHEFNTPLAIISSSTEVLQLLVNKKGCLDDQILQHFNTIMETIDRAQGVNDMLSSLAKNDYDEENLDLTLRKVDLNKLIKNIVGLYKGKLAHDSIDIYYEEKENFWVHANEGQLTQVFINLLDNSCKAISKKEKKWIRLNIDKADSQIVVSVTDSGDGISKEIQEKMFIPFFSTLDMSEGTGLGLTLAYKFMLMNEGNLVYNPDKKNTTFEVFLKEVS